ncbi:MAG: EamA family transporter [Phycisphaerales bacterium]|nr:EamA family transporter [Phycisphaerales bacterium]
MSVSKSANTGLIALAFAAVYIIWGSTYLAIHVCVKTMPPFLMAGTRFLLAGLILLTIMRSFDRAPITWPQWRAAAIIGALLLVGGNGLVCWAQQWVPSGIAGLLIATAPLWFAMLEWLVFRGARPTAGVFAGIAVGLLGIFLLLDPTASTERRLETRGVVALLAACFCWPLGSLYSRRAPRPASPLTATATQMLCGGGALVIVAALTGDFAKLDVGAITLNAWLAWLYLLVAGSIVAFSAYVWLLRVCSPALVSTYAFVNPVIAVGLGWLVGETPMTPKTALAMGVVLVGVIIITLSPKRIVKAVPQAGQISADHEDPVLTTAGPSSVSERSA